MPKRKEPELTPTEQYKRFKGSSLDPKRANQTV